MKTVDMDHLEYLSEVAEEDVRFVRMREATYRGSWKARGGAGAFFMLARKWDRLENILEDTPGYDIFAAIGSDIVGNDGSTLAEVRDLRRYLLLVEAEIVSRVKREDRVRAAAIPANMSLKDIADRVTLKGADADLAIAMALSMHEISEDVLTRLPLGAQMAYECRSKSVYRLSDFISEATYRDILVIPELERYFDTYGEGKFHALDRTKLTLEEREQRKRWQVEVNHHEYKNLPPEVRQLYNDEGDAGFRMGSFFVHLWGQKG